MLRLLQTGLVLILSAAAAEGPWQAARANGSRAEEMFSRSRRMLHAWLSYADKETLLLPDRLPGVKRGREDAVYTPHNSAADNYPYLIITSFFTDPALYYGRMMDMLRNEIRYTNVEGGAIPGNLDFRTRSLGPASFFGAAEYAKDGLISVTELLGKTPWYYRLLDMMEDFLRRADRPLPARGAELNGDVLQTLARLIPMTVTPASGNGPNRSATFTSRPSCRRTITCRAMNGTLRNRRTSVIRVCGTMATKFSWAWC